MNWLIEKALSFLGKSLRSTLWGICGIVMLAGSVGVMYLDFDPTTNPNWERIQEQLQTYLQALGGSSLGVGLFFARDNKVSDEKAGAK